MKVAKTELKRIIKEELEVINKNTTCINEQRLTKWVNTQSLNDFIDKENNDLTVEGYPRPKRGYIICTKK